MKHKQKLFLSLAGVSTLGLLALAVSAQGRFSTPSLANTPANEEVIEGEKLEGCIFSAYTFDGKTDSRQFTYSMPGGKYMEGAVLYGDCDHQSVGTNLSESFVLDNSDQPASNAADFHVLISAQGLTYAKFVFDIEIDKTTPSAIDFHYGIKLSQACPQGLYEGLQGRPYHGSPGNERGVVDSSGSTDFYDGGNYSPSQITTSDIKLTNKSYEYYPEGGSFNAAAFYVNPLSVPSGLKLSITLKSITLRYTC